MFDVFTRLTKGVGEFKVKKVTLGRGFNPNMGLSIESQVNGLHNGVLGVLVSRVGAVEIID